MLPFFEYTDVDSMFYRKYIAPRIPSRIFDVHVHIFLKEHVDMIPEESIKSFWASECAHVLSCDDAHACARELYPDTHFHIVTGESNAVVTGLDKHVVKDGQGRPGCDRAHGYLQVTGEILKCEFDFHRLYSPLSTLKN